jgi:Lar family restriction alleviation protein
MEELDELPCPHCGSKTIIFITAPRTGWRYCHCEDCGASGPAGPGKSGAIEQWNTRLIEDQQHAEILRLRNALTRIANSDGPRNITTGEGHSECVWAARKALAWRAENT